MTLGTRKSGLWISWLLALSLLVAACGSEALEGPAARPADDPEGGEADTDEAEGDGGGEGEPSVMRFAFAPDPVWDWLVDSGTMAEWEEEFNITIETSESWDEFAYFAGGHGDIVSMATYELPLLEAETGIKVVAFGQYNHLRLPLLTQADSGYETMSDIPAGSTMCAQSPVSATIFWSNVINALDGLDYRVGSGDYNLVVNDHFVNAELIERGECEGGIVIPEAAVRGLRTGTLKAMYGARAPWQIWQDVCECDHKGIMSNLFVATEDYFNNNPEEIEAFLELWQRGIEGWNENMAEIIATYPQHFAVENQEDIDWITGYLEENDWFVDTVYMDEEWIERETEFYDYMVENGWLEEDFPEPRFEVVEQPG